MTQEQRVTRGSIVIFILSIVLLLCLGLTATLAYFAGQQSSNMTLILGGPVRIQMHNAQGNDIGSTGTQELYMELKADNNNKVLPGMGINMQAIAHITSSQINATRALLRAKLDVSVSAPEHEPDLDVEPQVAQAIERAILKSINESLTQREENVQHGWVLYNNAYYYCSKNNGIASDGSEYIQLLPIETSDEGTNVTFINNTFQFPTKYYSDETELTRYEMNKIAHLKITMTLTFEAIQEVIVDNSGNRIPNTLANVKRVLDGVNWEIHNM